MPQPPSPSNPPQPDPARGRRRLAVGVAVIAVVWLVVLPAIGRLEPVRRKIEAEQARGIDPSAMFYTELEAMRPVQQAMDEVHDRDGHTLWHR